MATFAATRTFARHHDVAYFCADLLFLERVVLLRQSQQICRAPTWLQRRQPAYLHDPHVEIASLQRLETFAGLQPGPAYLHECRDCKFAAIRNSLSLCFVRAGTYQIKQDLTIRSQKLRIQGHNKGRGLCATLKKIVLRLKKFMFSATHNRNCSRRGAKSAAKSHIVTKKMAPQQKEALARSAANSINIGQKMPALQEERKKENCDKFSLVTKVRQAWRMKETAQTQRVGGEGPPARQKTSSCTLRKRLDEQKE